MVRHSTARKGETEDAETRLFERILAAVREPQARSLVQQLLQRCAESIADMREMEQTIYDMYVESGKEMWEMINAAALLQLLADRTLRGIRQLQTLLQTESASAGAAEARADEDLEFDLVDAAPAGALDPAHGAAASPKGEIEKAIELLLPSIDKSDAELLALVRSQCEVTLYGLQTQLAEFERRFASACEAERYTQALHELDDIRDALTDGVFALVASICDAYLGKLDRSEILPGHRTALEKSVLIRQRLTLLRGTVGACNARIQDSAELDLVRLRAFEHLCRTLTEFLEGEVLGAMRPADRWELERTGRALLAKPLAEARQSCEGLEKYLESLVSINQREVLVQHDRELRIELVEMLDAVAPLIAVSLKSAAQLFRLAGLEAEALLGVREDLDRLLIGWTQQPPSLDTGSELAAAIKSLRSVLGDR